MSNSSLAFAFDDPSPPVVVMAAQTMASELAAGRCGSAWKRDPGSGVIGVEKGPLIPLV